MWVDLAPFMPDDDERVAAKDLAATLRASRAGRPMTTREYLDAMCPVSVSKRIAPEDEDANTLGDGVV